eukprot:TRINITY_DN4541_c0_g2_i1.p1 TRINITY_DN4541_c0_g2~~TRINITY_DN4541_c0_g2_i1.p1  ORF type:complete len:384 (+),score=98.43 TRINITY_DN4541_c0_g2_i1:12-1163(+)
MLRRPPRSTQSRSSAASDVYKRQPLYSANSPTYSANQASRNKGGVSSRQPVPQNNNQKGKNPVKVTQGVKVSGAEVKKAVPNSGKRAPGVKVKADQLRESKIEAQFSDFAFVNNAKSVVVFNFQSDEDDLEKSSTSFMFGPRKEEAISKSIQMIINSNYDIISVEDQVNSLTSVPWYDLKFLRNYEEVISTLANLLEHSIKEGKVKTQNEKLLKKAALCLMKCCEDSLNDLSTDFEVFKAKLEHLALGLMHWIATSANVKTQILSISLAKSIFGCYLTFVENCLLKTYYMDDDTNASFVKLFINLYNVLMKVTKEIEKAEFSGPNGEWLIQVWLKFYDFWKLILKNTDTRKLLVDNTSQLSTLLTAFAGQPYKVGVDLSLIHI